MSFEFRLPDLGEGIGEAEIISWLVEVGAGVQVDQPLVQVQTDKMVVDIPSPVAGEVLKLGAEEGATVATGEVLAVFALTDGAAVAAAEMRVEHAASAQAPGRHDAPPQVDLAEPGGAAKRVKAAPAVRKLARDLGISLQDVRGTGANGRVTRDDVHAADVPALAPAHPASPSPATPSPPSPSPGERIPLRGVRRKIAEAMIQSWTRIPLATDFREVDATRLVQARREADAWVEPAGAVTYLALMTKIVAIALERHPIFNATLDEEHGEIVIAEDINIGIAVATADGVIVPVLHHANRMSVAEIAREGGALVTRARERKLAVADVRGGTFTLNNSGALAPIAAGYPMPLINWPQSATLAFNRIADRPAVVDGQVVARPTMLLTTNADHRLIDGAEIVAFTNDVVRLVENPDRMIGGAR